MPNKNELKRLSGICTHFQRRSARYPTLRFPLRTLSQWQAVPIISKNDLLGYGQRDAGQTTFNVTATSGTTASRLLIIHSKQSYDAHAERLAALYKSIGVSSKDLCLNLCAYDLNSGGRLMEVAFKNTGAGVIPLGSLDSLDKVQEAVDLAKALRPTIVNSYTNQLFDLFSGLGRRHSVRICIVTGEPLMDSFRKQMEKSFGIRIYNHYGSMEFSGFAIAQKPDDEYMKIFSQGLYIEVLQDNGVVAEEGEGAIVVTDLENTAMPFIRYRLGDRVEIRRAKGGKYIKVLGRLSDSILIHGETYAVADLVHCAQHTVRHPNFFFIVEKDEVTYKDKIILHLQNSDKHLIPGVRESFKNKFVFGGGLAVRVFQGQIPKTTTGKYRHIVDARKEFNKA